MIVRTETLLGKCLKEGQIPKIKGKPIVILPGTDGTLTLNQEILSTHAILIGATGSGKTNAMQFIIDGIIKSMTQSDVLLVFDPKHDFRKFHDDNTFVISNDISADKHTAWNIFMDIAADGWDREAIHNNCREIAYLTFSEAIDKSSQPFFPQGARDLYAALLEAMTLMGSKDINFRHNYLNNKQLKLYLNKPGSYENIKTLLSKFPELCGVLKYLGSEVSGQSDGIMGELQAVTGSLFEKNFGLDGRFSVRRFVRKRSGRKLFIEYDAVSGSSMRSVYRIICDLYLKEALANTSLNNGKVYFVCDELSIIPEMLHFPDALNIGRSKGITCIAAIQSMEQLYEQFGHDGGNNVVSAFRTLFCFSTDNKATREYVKGRCGSNYQSIQYIKPNGSSETVNREGYCVEDWDFLDLNRGEAIINLPFVSPFKYQIRKY